VVYIIIFTLLSRLCTPAVLYCNIVHPPEQLVMLSHGFHQMHHGYFAHTFYNLIQKKLAERDMYPSSNHVDVFACAMALFAQYACIYIGTRLLLLLAIKIFF